MEAAAGVEPAIEILQTSALTTWLRRPGVGVPDNDERQTTEHSASVLCLAPGGGLERVKGLEPSTFCMASRRSSQLSYTRSKRG